MVWVLVDLPPGCRTVGSKWIFKKKIDMDGIIHTYKARLVAKVYTQLYGVDYKETFSPVADIRAIRILISIAADRSKRLIGLGQNDYMDKILKRYKMDNSKRGHIPVQERLDLNKTQCASTPKENPGECHWTVVKNILKYLRNTKDMFLVYGGNPEAKLRVNFYCNAEFETDTDDMKSLIGYVSF
nr:retrovirus-related Pol polyprotein from transposon TNT 1-94 [Tanacetum cinerariifolium]